MAIGRKGEGMGRDNQMGAQSNQETTSTSELAPDARLLAEKAAQELVESGEKLKRVVYGREGASFFVSSDPAEIIGTETLEVDGNSYYIGIFRADGKE
jgi:hypothetical protein